jgi:hypothetical protein
MVYEEGFEVVDRVDEVVGGSSDSSLEESDEVAPSVVSLVPGRV